MHGPFDHDHAWPKAEALAEDTQKLSLADNKEFNTDKDTVSNAGSNINDSIKDEKKEEDVKKNDETLDQVNDVQDKLISKTPSVQSYVRKKPDNLLTILSTPTPGTLPPTPPTSADADKSFGQIFSEEYEALNLTASPRDRRLTSSSLRSVSRFFPPTPSALNPDATSWENAPVFGTSAGPKSSALPKGVTGLHLPGPILKLPSSVTGQSVSSAQGHKDGSIPQQHTSSVSSFGPQSHPNPQATQTGHGAQAYSFPYAQNVFTIAGSSSSHTTISQHQVPCAPKLKPLPDNYSTSRVNFEFFQPEESGGKSKAPMAPGCSPLALANMSAFASNMSAPEDDEDTPNLAHHMTNIEKIEEKAEETKSQKSLGTTGPTPSWLNDMRDWRSGTTATGSGNDSIAALNHSPDLLHSKPTKESSVAVHRPFRPMNNILYPRVGSESLSEKDKASRVQIGISPNYQGDPNNPKNHSAHIPDSENCALFLTNLPSDCTYGDLLRALARYRPGRVWSAYINPPKVHSPEQMRPFAEASAGHQFRGLIPPSYLTSAAKVIFYHPSEAQRLMKRALLGAGIDVRGRRIQVKYNRHKTSAQTYAWPTSRVLRITGPVTIVSEIYLSSLFDQYFEYHTESVIVRAENQDLRCLEWRFASMRAQAHSAYQLLKTHFPGVVEVRWVVDPCAGHMMLGNEGQQLSVEGGAQEK